MRACIVLTEQPTDTSDHRFRLLLSHININIHISSVNITHRSGTYYYYFGVPRLEAVLTHAGLGRTLLVTNTCSASHRWNSDLSGSVIPSSRSLAVSHG